MRTAEQETEANMSNVLIELSNKTTEVMAQNLVRAFERQGIAPFVFKIEADGTLRAVSGSPGTCDLSILSEIYPDRHPTLKSGFVGTKLLRTMLRTWRKEDVDAFILFDDGAGHKKVITEWGRKTGVPVFYVPEHGGALKGAVPKIYRSLKQRVATRLEQILFPQSCWTAAVGESAAYVCAPNETFKSWLQNTSSKHQTISVTGSPLYDDVVVQDIPITAPNRDVIFVHQPMLTRSKRYIEFLRALIENVENDGRFNLIIKVHPRSSPAELDLISVLLGSKTANNLVSVVTSGDVRNAINQAGVAVMACSTALNDALLGGVPVVILKQAFGDGFDAYADEYGAAIAVNSPEELGPAIENALLNAETRAALRNAIANQAIPRYFAGLDMRPSERVVAFVLANLRKS